MKEYLKKTIQAILVEKRHRLYEERIAGQKVPFCSWLKGILEQERAEILAWKEKRGEGEQAPLSVSVLSREECGKYIAMKAGSSFHSRDGHPAAPCRDYGRFTDGDPWEGLGELWIITSDPDALVQEAVWEVRRYFEEHPDCAIAYGDEDSYLKPDWSPELLQSFFYFGNIVAVRKTLLEKAMPRIRERRQAISLEWTALETYYDMVLCCIDEAGTAGHIEKILFLSREISGMGQGFPKDSEIPANYRDWGREPVFEAVKKGHRYSDVEISKDRETQELVSVIIPSKDNPAVLSKCIHSLWERTDYGQIEIIVVDNGSSEENRARILRIKNQMKEEYHFRYLYKPMEFNFSAMCNLGAKEAEGKYLLFLNDDIEIAEENWLRIMLSRAAKESVGAVGAKLLYPNSDRIQHAGVVSIHLGPAHKLQFSTDGEEYYHGYNRCAVNASAVTGACLLVRKSVFEEMGGFAEQLRVAFNDVEFCFHLLRAGYRNVCCNDTFLYHHESLSRGSDAGLEKVERLHRERDVLYGAYPEMWNRDVWYSRKLVTDILDRGFEPASRFEEKRAAQRVRAERMKGSEWNPAWHNACLRMGLEFTGDEKAWRTGKPGEGDYYLQGWSYALDVDNSRYRKSLLLKPMKGEGGEEEELWRIPYEDCYRPDLEENLMDIDHPALSGLSIWVARDALPAGKYLIGFFWEDTCSRQKLYGFTAETLSVSEV